MHIDFRLAARDDVPIVSAISAEAYVAAYVPVIGVVPAPAGEDYGRWIEKGKVWLACSNAEPLAVLVSERHTDHLMVYSVAVLPSHQGRGLGAALLTQATERARAFGLGELRLYTNRRMERNVRLYRRCGFVEIGERPHPSRSGEVLVDMVKATTSGCASSTMRDEVFQG